MRRFNVDEKHVFVAVMAVSAVLALGVGMAVISTASATGSNLNSASTTYYRDSDTIRAVWFAGHEIQAKGAYGYGVLTDRGLDGIIVTTTHGGVYDSAVQKDASDPAWHNHYVKLQVNETGPCGQDLQVRDLTYESPGTIQIAGDIAIARDLPTSFNGTSALTMQQLSISPGKAVANAVTFDLVPKFDEEGVLTAVCVTDVQPAHTMNVAERFNN